MVFTAIETFDLESVNRYRRLKGGRRGLQTRFGGVLKCLHSESLVTLHQAAARHRETSWVISLWFTCTYFVHLQFVAS